MGNRRTPEELAKVLHYILAKRPDEFGLVPDREGYVKIKELLKALSEDEGLKHVRKNDLSEIILSVPEPPIELTDSLIRAKNRETLPEPVPADSNNMPKLLYGSIRTKAHRAVLEYGLRSSENAPVILSSEKEIAEKLGKRKDPAPLIIEIHVKKTVEEGILFQQYGESLFLVEAVPPACLSAPPLPKTDKKAETTKPIKKKPVEKPFSPGSFFLEKEFDPDQKKENARKKRKKEIARDKDKKQKRREKQKMWSR